MADKTTVLITQKSGPHVVPDINYQAWTSADRLSDGTLPAPQPVLLDPVTGAGSVDVEPGVWWVDEFVPQNASPRHAWLVPASDEPVYFTDLVEVTNTDLLGFGPVWAQQARASAMRAVAAAAEAEGHAIDARLWAELAEDYASVAAAPRYTVSSDGETATFEPSAYVVPSADGTYLSITGGAATSGFRVPRLAANGDLLIEQIPLADVLAYVLERIPAATITAAVTNAISSPTSTLRVALDGLYTGAGTIAADGEAVLFIDTDGRPFYKLRSEL
jgi:hypothetical protein